MRDCPLCGCTLVERPSLEIAGCYWTATTLRWDCPEGHTFLLLQTSEIKIEPQTDTKETS